MRSGAVAGVKHVLVSHAPRCKPTPGANEKSRLVWSRLFLTKFENPALYWPIFFFMSALASAAAASASFFASAAAALASAAAPVAASFVCCSTLGGVRGVRGSALDAFDGLLARCLGFLYGLAGGFLGFLGGFSRRFRCFFCGFASCFGGLGRLVCRVVRCFAAASSAASSAFLQAVMAPQIARTRPNRKMFLVIVILSVDNAGYTTNTHIPRYRRRG